MPVLSKSDMQMLETLDELGIKTPAELKGIFVLASNANIKQISEATTRVNKETIHA